MMKLTTLDNGLKVASRTMPGVETVAVERIADFKRTPLHGCFVSVNQVVIGDRVPAGSGQRLAGVGADVAGTAGNEDWTKGHRSALAVLSTIDQ